MCLKSAGFDKKTELGEEEMIPIFFSESPSLRACAQVKIPSTSKTCDMSDDPEGF